MDETKTDSDFSLILASSVHDMKNSVGMLLNSLEEFIGEADPQNDEQSRRLGVLQYEASRISGELIQLLSIYRMQGNRLPVHIDEQFVSDTFDDQIARNEMLFRTRGVDVSLNCDSNLRWYYDNELVGGIVHNVLINAARYTRSAIQLSAAIIDDWLCITIADDGRGYPQEMLDQPLAVDSGVNFESGSTNLGLFFAARVAALHRQNERQGYIRLENGGPLRGGQFKLYLP